MFDHKKFWRGEDGNDDHKRKKQARPPARQYNERGYQPPVSHALGVNVSTEHHYSIHVYLIFHQFDNMAPGNFIATLSFRTMFNDYQGMKTIDFSPATEHADPLYDVNGGNLRGVMVAQRMFMCKIGWVKRELGKEELYSRFKNYLPYAKKPEKMTEKEWEEERRVHGPEPRTKWVLEAIRKLKEERYWEELPKEEFKKRHKEVKTEARMIRGAIGSRRTSSDMERANRLDKIMTDVRVVLYSE
ncbi:uncharacterized protein EAE97_006586 [Botrytis byssoidea]|uniref:Uncharacterized protein n=1 Tax=Botrytis byssoidea TaxID=139641 RepID=A0A9P5IHZ2_9HELO|nr:uncharacterized protein EAE97_006586 [Botrytis byssoidea]KAF7941749.1 hypothetical protein EAE97_006586 [Botrytis byssoidea]